MTRLFDVDRTLLRGSTGRFFLTAGARRGLFPHGRLLELPRLYLRYWLGRLEADAPELELPLLRGLRRETLEELAESAFLLLRSSIYPGAERLVVRLRGEGEQVVLATSSLDLIVAPLARHFGAEEVLASRLEFEGGVCTGRFQGLPLLRREKTRRVLDWLAGRGVPAADCTYYTDSIHDLSLLEAVGEPVAVNPDWRLAREARRRGWSILRF